MPEFDGLNPPKSVTHPKAPDGTDPSFPAVVYKPASEPSADTMTVAWKGKEPIYNDTCRVADEHAMADAVKAGWSKTPVVKEIKK